MVARKLFILRSIVVILHRLKPTSFIILSFALFAASCSKPDSEDPVISLVTINDSLEDTVHVEVGDGNVMMLSFSDNINLGQSRVYFEYAGIDSFEVVSYPLLEALHSWERVELTELAGKNDGIQFEVDMSHNSAGDWSVSVECLDEEGNEAEDVVRLIRAENLQMPSLSLTGTTPEANEFGKLEVTQFSSIELSGMLQDDDGLDSLLTVFYDPAGDSVVAKMDLLLGGVTSYDLADLVIEVPATEAPNLYLTLVAYDMLELLNGYTYNLSVVD